LAVDKNLFLMLNSSRMGRGEPVLGEKLMKSFLTVLFESGSIPAKIACLNSGIFLTTEGSPVAHILKDFEDNGSEILSCSTCLEYFDRKDKLVVGQPTNMKDAVGAMLGFKKILTP